MESPPTPEIDDWLGSLDRRLGSTPALASPVPVHPPAEAPSRDTVTLASDAVGAAASPEQVDELANRPGAQFDALQKSRADLAKFQEEIHAFHASCAEITEVAGKLAVDRTAFEGFVQRVADFQQRLPGLDSEMDSISAKWSVAGKAVTVLGKKTDGLEARVDKLQQKQTDLESLQDRLNQVDELSNRTGAQFDALQKSRADLETFQEEIQAFHTSRAEITEVAGQLAVDRTAFEGFVQRVADFQQRLPGLDSEMDSISTKWSVAKKAVTVLGKQTDRLEDRFGQLLILLAPGRAGASIPRSDTLISVRVLV